MNTWRRNRSPCRARPCGTRATLLARSVVLRAYVLNTGHGWTAIPGGLVSVAETEGSVVSMQRGGHSKDAWVLWDSPVDSSAAASPQRAGGVAPRVAGRAQQRGRQCLLAGTICGASRAIARIVRCLASRVRRASESELACLVRLHSCLESRQSKLPRTKNRRPTSAEFEQELISMVTDPKRLIALLLQLAEVSRIGGNVRERLSSDMTSLIGQLRDKVAAGRETQFLEYPAMLTNCLELLSAFSGMERENINRGVGWLFMSIGRRLERAMFLTRQLREITHPLAESGLAAAGVPARSRPTAPSLIGPLLHHAATVGGAGCSDGRRNQSPLAGLSAGPSGAALSAGCRGICRMT